MRGSLIPSAKRLANRTAPIDPTDMTEANANNYMFLFDNISTGDYIEDAAIAGRHLKQLLAREQSTPNLTLEVLAGVAWFAQNTFIAFAGGNSPSFTAPATNPRIDILSLRNDGLLYRIAGSEAVSPVAPTIPSTDIAIAQVYNVVGQTTIRDNDSQVVGQGYIQYDLRPFVQVAVGSSAMPKLGIVARAQASTGSIPYVTALSYTGAGRLWGINFNTGSGAQFIRLTIDGIVFTQMSSPGAGNNKITFKAGNSTDTFDIAAGAAAFNELGIFFKTSLLVEHNNGGGGSVTTVVQYEHE